MRETGFEGVLDRTQEVLEALTSRLKSTSTPWFSTRYLGHMNSDTLMISNLAEIATLLYNPNNVAYESSVATSQMETEVGRDFAVLMGYDPEQAWGHITTDGTVANYEGLWLARNLKSLPTAVRAVKPALVAGKSDWDLLNFTTQEALDLVDAVKADRDAFAAVLEHSSRGAGLVPGGLGKVLVPSTRHYSWDKAADLLGIGLSNLVEVPVDARYRMDLVALQSVIDDFVATKTPILALVNVVGTTEEGAIDDVAGMRRLIDVNRERGTNFYFHVDAAYGGYARALFLDDSHKFMSLAEVRTRLSEDGFRVYEVAQRERLVRLRGDQRCGLDHRRPAQDGLRPVRGRRPDASRSTYPGLDIVRCGLCLRRHHEPRSESWKRRAGGFKAWNHRRRSLGGAPLAAADP